MATPVTELLEFMKAAIEILKSMDGFEVASPFIKRDGGAWEWWKLNVVVANARGCTPTMDKQTSWQDELICWT